MVVPTSVPPEEPVATILSEGDVLAGRYRILRFIAQGGMGEVYAAEDAELRETIALKVLRPEAARDSLSYERFRREIQAARRIVHPNVARIFDIERHVDAASGRSLAFLTMELLPGETLAELLERKGPLPPAEALPIVRQVAAALVAAHRAGVVHRDLKPGNVILVPEKEGVRAVVTDFNLAALRADDGGSHGSRLTQADLVVGTACYMAPEQAQGLDITGLADLYALGVVIFEMVTARLPHEADSAVSLLLKRLQERPPEPKAFAPDLPESWNTAILRCLAIRPEDRFASADELVTALEGEAPVAVPEFPRPGAPGRRARALVALLVTALAAALIFSLSRASRRSGRAPLQGVQLTASLGLDLHPAFAPEGDALAFASNRGGGFEIFRRSLGAAGAETPLTNDGKENVEPVFTPDGASVVYHSKGRGGLWVVPAAGGAPRMLVPFGSRPSFSRDGRLVVFQSEPLLDLSPNAAALPPSTIWVAPLSGGAPRQLTMPGRPEGGHGDPVFSPDGKRVVFLSADSRNAEVWQMNADGSALVKLAGGIGLLRDPVFAPDGRTLYLAATPEGGNPSLLRFRLGPDGLPEGRPETLASFPLGKIRHLAISKDGGRLAYSLLAVASNIWAVEVDPATGERRGAPLALTAETGRMTRPDFSPDGRRIAFSRYRSGTSDDLFLVNADGTGLAQVTSSASAETWPTWFADGKRLAFLSDRGGHAAYWVRSLADGVETRLFDPGTDFDAPRLSRDGTRVAWNSRRGGRLNVWVAEIAAGPKSARQVTFDTELMGWPCWSPDGKLLAVQARRGNDTHLALIPSDGGSAEFLVTEPGQTWPSAFSPDGDRIAFAGQRGGVWNVYMVSRATRATAKLTDFAKGTAYVRYPAWSPRGDRVAFEYAETAGNIWLLELPR